MIGCGCSLDAGRFSRAQRTRQRRTGVGISTVSILRVDVILSIGLGTCMRRPRGLIQPPSLHRHLKFMLHRVCDFQEQGCSNTISLFVTCERFHRYSSCSSTTISPVCSGRVLCRCRGADRGRRESRLVLFRSCHSLAKTRRSKKPTGTALALPSLLAIFIYHSAHTFLPQKWA